MAHGAWAQGSGTPSADRPNGRDIRTETGTTKITAPFTVAAVGDIIAPQPLYRNDPGFMRLIEIIRKSDVGFANMESSLLDFRRFQGPVTGTGAPLSSGDSIKWMGITLVNHANNHALDGGVEGMLSTDEALDALGIIHAGTGRNLQEARAPRYLETPKGRVGLIGMYSIEDVGNFGPTYAKTEATLRNGELGGQAGVSPLHLTTYHIVTAEQLQQLQQIAAAVYGDRFNAAQTGPDGAKRFRFFDEWYQVGPNPGTLHYEMEPADEREILQSIRNGKVYSDFFIATIHVHQTPNYCGQCMAGNTGNGMKEGIDHYPADFVIKLAHDAIDAGADMFIAHGVHAMSGMEIYKGKPIFYGLSNFVFQFGLQFGTGYNIFDNYTKMAALENDATEVGVLTTSHFENGKLTEVRLYPVDLGGVRRPLSSMGIPSTPSPEDANRILSNLQEYSKPFGTQIAIEDNVGVIRVGGNDGSGPK